MRRLALILLSAWLWTLPGAPAALAQQAGGSPIVADLSEDLISITTGFTGTNVLLFGATDGAGDVLVVVQAPPSRVVVRRKEKISGIWVNADSFVFDEVPGFYHIASTGPLSEILPAETLTQEQIGAANLSIVPVESTTASEEQAFRQALIRNKRAAGLFNNQPGTVEFLGNRLFRTRVSLPSNVPTGRYQASIYLIRDGEIVGRTQTPLQVRKAGFEAAIFEFAHIHSSWYGIIAIVVALVAGWFAGFVFRKV